MERNLRQDLPGHLLNAHVRRRNLRTNPSQCCAGSICTVGSWSDTGGLCRKLEHFGCVISERCSCWQFSEAATPLVAHFQEPQFFCWGCYMGMCTPQHSPTMNCGLWRSQVLEKISTILDYIDIHIQIWGVTNCCTDSPWCREVGGWWRHKSPPCCLLVTSLLPLSWISLYAHSCFPFDWATSLKLQDWISSISR